jgi:hypothetical protein
MDSRAGFYFSCPDRTFLHKHSIITLCETRHTQCKNAADCQTPRLHFILVIFLFLFHKAKNAGAISKIVTGSGIIDGVGRLPILHNPPPLTVPNPIVGPLSELNIRTLDHFLGLRFWPANT